MPQLRSIFEKDLGRYIEGVIKVDAKEHLKTEVEEYVITNEVARRLEDFLEQYTKTQGVNGSWISGFFGSGKSHLLKMLALLLDDPELSDGSHVRDHFIQKAKGNPILEALIKKTASIPSENILFNIDNKADLITRDQRDAILSVFLKVFNDHMGFYGKVPYIAQFERDLQKNGLYESFMHEFQSSANKTWKQGRETPDFVMRHITAAIQKVTQDKEDGRTILDRYKKDFSLSIEEFGDLVADYLKQKPANFRLNFFVDEIGQFIADDTQLMLNLQTIAESLSSKCKGRAWIIVTSQEAIDKIVGDMNARQANDFSKIQARFSVRLPMSSQNVEEVIQKRLLSKNETGNKYLKGLHQRTNANFGTLFNFADGSQSLNNFRDEDHFINSFPFIPYQYPLFQGCLESLSAHNAFEGRNAAVGERSMLAVFQFVLKSIADNEIGELATFDQLYEGISAALKSQVITSIRTADQNLPETTLGHYARRILRALFLVKYYKGFKATIHNLTVLMTDRLDGNIKETRNRIQEALDLLERESYIERNNNIYIFLTNEEKDVESEIKNTPVEISDQLEKIKELTFGSIINNTKIRHAASGQDFAFTKYVDNKLFGREEELAIRIISPYHDHAADIRLLTAHSLGKSELDIVLPLDSGLMQDLKLYKQTDKYLIQNRGGANPNIQVILTQKAFQNDDRLKGISAKLIEDISKSRMLVMGEEQNIPADQALSRIQAAFQILVNKTYTNLPMIAKTTWAENMVASLAKRQPQLTGLNQTLSEAEQEILGRVQAQKRANQRVTVKMVIEIFEKKPYGWSLAAIECNLAKLFAADQLDFYQNSTLLTEQTLPSKLTTTSNHDQIVIEPHFAPATEKVKALREFFVEFFAQPAPSDDRALPGAVAQAIADELQSLEETFGHRSQHPFLQDLSKPINTLREHKNKSNEYYLDEFLGYTNSLLDLRDDIIMPIRNIFNGNNSQNKIYFDARTYFTQQTSNFQQVSPAKAAAMEQLLNDPLLYKGGKIPQLNAAYEELRTLVDGELGKVRQQAVASFDEYRKKLSTGYPEYQNLSESQQQELLRRIDGEQGQVQASNQITDIKYRADQFANSGFDQLLARMTEFVRGNTKVAEPPSSYVSYRLLNIPYQATYLGTEQDVDAYLEKVRQTLLEEISKGNRINLG